MVSLTTIRRVSAAIKLLIEPQCLAFFPIKRLSPLFTLIALFVGRNKNKFLGRARIFNIALRIDPDSVRPINDLRFEFGTNTYGGPKAWTHVPLLYSLPPYEFSRYEFELRKYASQQSPILLEVAKPFIRAIP